MIKLFKFFEEPYPMQEIGLRDVMLALASGIFVMGYLMFFSPSGPLTSSSMVVKLSGYALITMLFLLFNAFIIKNLLQLIFKAEKWTIGKQFIWYGYVIFTIGLLLHYYSQSLELYGFSIEQHIIAAFIFGTLLFGAFILFNYRYLSYKYGKRAGILNQLLKPPRERSNRTFSFKASETNDNLTIGEDKLSFIKKCSMGSELYMVENGNPTIREVKNPFNQLVETMSNECIIRCHPEYLINLSNLEQVGGTAQGYRLKFFLHNERVPVDKNYRHVFQQKLSKN
ncbi:MAG: LytTR family transcriptional regulator DNA-binding domain-containing protein [Cyclobacteriaceae bacterium]